MTYINEIVELIYILKKNLVEAIGNLDFFSKKLI